MRANLKPIALLAFLQLLSFGIFAFQLGFYHDDWVLLDGAAAAGTSLWAIIGAMAKMFWGRPGEIVIFSLLIKTGGMHAACYQIAVLALGISEAWLFYLLIDALTGRPSFALIAAALASIYPNREAAHFWFGDAPQTVAQALLLSSLLCHLRWTEIRRIKWLAASLLFYLVSMLSYESGAFMPLLLGGGLLVRRVLHGEPTRKSAAKTALDLTPYLAPFSTAVSLQWVVLPRLTHVLNQKSSALGFSLGHALKIYGAGFECVTNRVIHACFLGFLGLLHEFSLGRILACVALAAATALFLREQDDRDRSLKPVKIALGMAIAGFIGSYGPYALSGTYIPRIFGVMSRTNGTGAWIGGLLAASGLAALSSWRPRGMESAGRRASHGLLTLLLTAFTWTNWHVMLQWSRSWTAQRDILAKVGQKVSKLSGPAAIFLADYPSTINTAIVFSATYDFDAALRLTSGRRDLVGNILSINPMRFEKKGMIVDYGNQNQILYPYHNLYFYHYEKNFLERIDGPPKT